MSCWIVNNGVLNYEFSWNVQGNEPPPANLDGIWSPTANFTNDDITAIMKSMAVGEIILILQTKIRPIRPIYSRDLLTFLVFAAKGTGTVHSNQQNRNQEVRNVRNSRLPLSA